MLRILHFPDVIIQLCLGSDHLAAVGHAAAAYGQNQVNIVFPGYFSPLLNLGIGGVGHDPGKFHDSLSGGIQNAHDLVIDPVALDGAAAIGQHHRLTIVFQQAAQVFLHAVLTKVDLGFVLENKVVHNKNSFQSSLHLLFPEINRIVQPPFRGGTGAQAKAMAQARIAVELRGDAVRTHGIQPCLHDLPGGDAVSVSDAGIGGRVLLGVFA